MKSGNGRESFGSRWKKSGRISFLLLFLMCIVCMAVCTACGNSIDAAASPRVTDLEVSSDNQGSLDSQFVTAELLFDRAVKVGKDPLANMHITIAGESTEQPEVTQPADDRIAIRIPVTAVTRGNLQIAEAKEGEGFPGVTDKTGSYSAWPFTAEMLIPTGVTLDKDTSYTGSGIAVIVNGTWNIRCITWMRLLEDGVPVQSAVTQPSELYGDGAVAVHGHDFLISDSVMIAEAMAESLNRHFGNLYVFYNEGNHLIGEKMDATEGGNPELEIYEEKRVTASDD